MLNFEKTPKWILIPLAILISSLAGLIIVYTYLLVLGKAEINLTSIITAVLAAILAPWVGIKAFLSQQRVARVQKIYYEESLLDQLKHLDEVINITNQNIMNFEKCINLIRNRHSLFMNFVNTEFGNFQDSCRVLQSAFTLQSA